jgi:hypothetical protein
MPLPIIPAAPFPNVPALPGVPQLVRSLLFPPSPLPSIGSQASSGLWASSGELPTWGVFDSSGTQVIDPDNIFSLSNRNEWRLLDYPVQDGAFASFNKVIVPFEVSVRMTKGGSQSDRSAFLDQIEAIAGDLNLYDILTPEVTYTDVNITRYELTRRSAEGAFFLEVDLFFRQILQVAAQYSTSAANTQNAQNPAAVPPDNTGLVQSQPAPANAQAIAQNALTQAPM